LLAASAEFIERADALPAFQSAYGFKLKQDQLLTLAGGDTSVTIKAAAEQTSGVNAAMAYGTDGPVAALGLVTLDDVKGAADLRAAPIIRSEVLAKQPKIAAVLKPVFLSLTGPTLQKLNASIAIEGRDARKVAQDYLKKRALSSERAVFASRGDPCVCIAGFACCWCCCRWRRHWACPCSPMRPTVC
jgi:osmoprotectant transport system substrate-binding protein